MFMPLNAIVLMKDIFVSIATSHFKWIESSVDEDPAILTLNSLCINKEQNINYLCSSHVFSHAYRVKLAA